MGIQNFEANIFRERKDLSLPIKDTVFPAKLYN